MKLYVSDLDGTLLNSSARLKQRARDILNRFINKGIQITFATARGIDSALAVTEGVDFKIPVIVTNGVFIYDTNMNKRIVSNVFSNSATDIIKNYLLTSADSPLVYSLIDGEERVSYFADRTEQIKSYLNARKGDKRFRPCTTWDEIFEGQMYYITLINPITPLEEMDKLFNRKNGIQRNYQADTYDKDEYWYEIFSETASKANAVRQLKELLGANEVITFGDNMNDIPMFSVSDRSYAVENAFPEAKAAATGIIGSNEACGVPLFIEKDNCEQWRYEKHSGIFAEADDERFQKAVEMAVCRESSTIGTLNEKCVHSALKYYYCSEIGHEAKIGSYYADAIGENGIYEIQTASWNKLCPKLDAFLDVSHVSVVYPLPRKIHSYYAEKNTGECLKKVAPRSCNDLTKFFLELYRIKAYLANPNLTVVIAELEMEKVRFVDNAKCVRKRGQRIENHPLKLLREIYLEDMEDYRIFLPENLPEEFDKKQFSSLVKHCDGSILLEILEYMCVVEKIGKKGNAFIYKVRNYDKSIPKLRF